MICLGIESTAHTFGAAVVRQENGKTEILSNVRDIYKPPAGWGIEPVKAAKHHRELRDMLIDEAIVKAGIGPDCVDLVAWSQGPGLPPCLVEGKIAAFDFAEKYRKPVLGVNHCIAHIEIGRHFAGGCDPVTLYVSGANTQIIAYAGGRYRCFGETMDIGLGNALDKFGRESGMQFPAGPKVEQLAKTGKWIGMPYVVKGMDLSFSGITTEALKKLKAGEKMEDVCFSLQESAFAMAAEVSERAMAHTEKEFLILTGGVAANQRLCGMLETMCRERGAGFFPVPREYAGDNAAMIALTGLLAHNAGLRGSAKEDIMPCQRTDDVDARWME